MKTRVRESIRAEDWARDRNVPPAPSSLGPHGVVPLPLDLRECFTELKLLSWVSEEIERSAASRASTSRVGKEGQDHALLGLLSFSYLAGCFTSEEIIRACHADTVFLFLCANTIPFRHELARLRRTFRPRLERVLAGVLRRAMWARSGRGSEVSPMDLDNQSIRAAKNRLDIARHLDAGDE